MDAISIPKVEKDTVFHDLIVEIEEKIKKGAIVEAVEREFKIAL